ncbi:hypothetical protein AVEN_108186-1, partial [Araneus ventricosus]
RERGFGFEETTRALLALGPDSEALLQKEDRTGLEMRDSVGRGRGV